MCDKVAISAYILKIVEKDPFLRLQIRGKEMLNRHQFYYILPHFIMLYYILLCFTIFYYIFNVEPYYILLHFTVLTIFFYVLLYCPMFYYLLAIFHNLLTNFRYL